MRPLQRSEFDDQADDDYQVDIYRQLEWLRISRKYKPGWTFFVYQEAFRRKPEKWMEGLEPREPSKELLLWLGRRNAAFKKERDVGRRTNGGGTVGRRGDRKDLQADADGGEEEGP